MYKANIAAAEALTGEEVILQRWHVFSCDNLEKRCCDRETLTTVELEELNLLVNCADKSISPGNRPTMDLECTR